jgi:hypothetical protein
MRILLLAWDWRIVTGPFAHSADRPPLGFFRLPLPQAHSGPTSILIDKLNARAFECAANGQVIRHR